MYYVAYNPTLGNAAVGDTPTQFETVPDGILIEAIDEDMPDISKSTWSEGSLRFIPVPNKFCTQTEFMRKFTQAERLAIRQLERDGDLVIVDAMSLIAGTKEGVDLDDPDVLKTLQYLAYVKSIITPNRIQEILS